MSEERGFYSVNPEKQSAAAALFGKPNYQGIARACTAQVELTLEQAGAVLHAYDRGIEQLDDAERQSIDAVIAQLKDHIWP